MGVKISSLPVNALPYTGAEKIPLVQGGITRAGTLSSFVSYLSGALLSDSELRALSGNWQNTYTTFSSNSANYALKNVTNVFPYTQIFASGIQVGNNTIFKEIPETGSSGQGTFAVGKLAGNEAGASSSVFQGNILVGSNAGSYAGANYGSATDVISIGSNSGEYAGYNVNGGVQDIINIGRNAGKSAGYISIGSVNKTSDVISIGTNTGMNIGSGYTYGRGEAVSIVAIGSNAASSLGSANENSYAGYANKIVAIGESAGSFAGSASLDANGSIQNAILIGTDAGSYVGAGGGDATQVGDVQDMIAIGRSAGYGRGQAGVAYDNIYIGREAGYNIGYSLSGTNNNIFIGLSSGYTKQGSRNTFIGDLTNTSPTSAVNLSGCIALGYGATPTARNTIAIGSTSTPLSVVPGGTLGSSLSGLKIMINGRYFTIPLLP